MKVRIQLDIEEKHIDEVVEAPDAEGVLRTVQDKVAKALGWKGLLIRALTPLQFAQEAVKRYNEAKVKNHPLPTNVDEFVEFGKAIGYLTVIEE